MTGVRLADGTVVERAGGFVRPVWTPALGFADGLDLDRDADGYLADRRPGPHVACPASTPRARSTPPGPQQLIVAAGSGAVVAAAVNRDLIGLSRRTARAVL